MPQDHSAVISIRNAPRELLRDAKIAAAQRGITLRQLVLEAIAAALNKNGGKK